MKSMKKFLVVLTLGAASTMMAAGALAQQWPLAQGDYWEVTGITVKDGGNLKYANWLATEWKKNAEFAKSKGWIKGYHVFANVYGRKGEPDLYLVRVIDSVVSGAEGEKRTKEYFEWQKKSMEALAGESGNRAEFREVVSSSLLQEMKFR